MRTPVHSSQLQFTRDGRTLVIAEPDAVTLVELRGDERRQIAIPGVQVVAAFADQVWVATRTGILVRLDSDGRRLDEHALPIDPAGLLIPAAIGGPAALWTGCEPVTLVDDLGSLAIRPGNFDAAIPIAGRRLAHYAGPRLTLPAGTSVTLAGAAQIAGGSVVFEGTSLALVAGHPRGRDIVVLALASGRVLQTLALPPGMVRIAARRGLAVVHDAARRLAVIDLRFARHLGAVVTEDDVIDVAIDPDGRLLAIRLGSGALELARLGERMGAATRLSVSLRATADHEVGKLEPPGMGAATRASASLRATADHEAAKPPGMETPEPASEHRSPEHLSAEHPSSERPSPEPPWPESLPSEALPSEPRSSGIRSWEEPLSGSPPSEPEPDILTSAPRPSKPRPPVIVDALEPRPHRERLPRVAALVELDREIRSVTLWALRAISSAWDSRRLGYSNEGHHPYEHEVAALVGKNAGFAPDYLAAARDALAEHEAALAADPRYRSAPTPIAELIDELGLSPAAVDVLLVIAAPSLHGDVARLYGILGNDPGRALVDELLVHQVLGDRISRHDIAAELHPRAPLVRLGIVDLKKSRPRPFAALEVDPVVLSRLRGEPPSSAWR